VFFALAWGFRFETIQFPARKLRVVLFMTCERQITDDDAPQVTGRVWRGSAFGGVKGRTELPGIVGGKYSLHRLTRIIPNLNRGWLTF
jgi:Zn-dependent alcohol dehydrogenase